MLKATAKQHGIRSTGELVSCLACSRAKGYRAPTPHHATRRATQSLGLVHIDTAGPYPTSLGGSWYVVMFVDSASRLQWPYSVREKSAAAILSVIKRFVADMGVPRAFRTDNGTEYSNGMFVDFCNGLGIRREFTAPYTPQQWIRRERNIASFQGWTRGATWSFTAVPWHPPGRDPGLYRRGRNDPLARVATLGIGGLQQGGNISE